jgi:hypothetical protein
MNPKEAKTATERPVLKLQLLLPSIRGRKVNSWSRSVLLWKLRFITILQKPTILTV